MSLDAARWAGWRFACARTYDRVSLARPCAYLSRSWPGDARGVLLFGHRSFHVASRHYAAAGAPWSG